MPTPEQIKAQKDARKKARQAAKRLPPPKVAADALRRLELFDGVPQKALDEFCAVAEGTVLGRDDMLVTPSDNVADPYLNFIVAGQVGCGEWTDEAQKSVGKKAKAELFKKVGQTIAVFAYGDFYADDFGQKSGLCLYAITETQVVRVKASAAQPVLKRNPALADRLRRHAERWLHRIRYLREEGGRDDVFDFYVKNGFSFSTRTKIRQLELCIDCDKCVVGCEDRHGFARIERFGPQVGLINFSITCRQCYDPRCLIDCNFDAIARDPISHEIRVDIESCTGCSVCARSCPNDSIFVHEITPDMDTSLWEDAGRKVPKKVAQKCDRCAGYDDMACIAACPTGSMVDAVPELIFGLDSSKPVDESCDTRVFEQGWSEHATPRALPKFLYGLSAVLILMSTMEWIFRRWMPDLSFLPVYAAEVAKGDAFDPGRGLGLLFGIIGALCMLATLIYVVRNRLETTFSFMGGKYLWFAIHNALGVLGPALVFLHGNLLFSKWPSVGVWSMIFVVLSGFLGQYLANQLPGKQYRNTRERTDLDKGLLALSRDWGEHTRAFNVAEMMMKTQLDDGGPSDAQNIGTLRFLLFLVTDDIRRFLTLSKLRFGELRKVRNKAIRRQLLDIQKQRLQLERQDRFYRTAGRLVSQWKLFHIFFSIGLFLLMMLHVGVVTVF
jgi:Fe-S-cluster-containing hydrogenase component 2